jgi:ABC-2 type transport system permease protein
MATNVQHGTGNSMMVLETGAGWQRGLNNVLRAELQHWFGTRMWLWQILIWAMCVNLIFLMVALTASEMSQADALMIFNIFLGLAGPIGVCIIMQSAVVGEKRSGTAAWVLSKPVSRQAFILSKLIANGLGIMATMVLAQGVIAYFISGLVLKVWPPIPGFLAGLGVQYVNILFYLTLTLMLGAIFEHPAPVIGIPLAFLFFQQYLIGFYPPLGNILPWTLVIPVNGSQALSLSMALMSGPPLPSLLPLISTIIFCILFTVIAVFVFSRKEL